MNDMSELLDLQELATEDDSKIVSDFSNEDDQIADSGICFSSHCKIKQN